MSLKFVEFPSTLRLLRLSEFPAWSILDHIWLSLLGRALQDFEAIPGVTPFVTLKAAATIIMSYYMIILSGQELMRSQPAFRLNYLFLIHNAFLTAVSGGLLVLFVEQLAPILWRHGLWHSICGPAGWNKQLMVLYYLNYITKYVELLDTMFLVLRKKPLTFLHCYHHGATALLCYIQLAGRTSISWVPITLNLTVHVVMYWYYFQSARGVRVWWKEWITKLQIAQFVIDLGFIYFGTYNFYAHAYFNSLPHIGHCAGEEPAPIIGCIILSSYLVLFIFFYFATYKQPGRTVKHTTKKSLANRKMTEVSTEPVLATICSEIHTPFS